tara:strand:- start:8374 stop:8514 length:141 start_codon:yes stop_codon:yes gene_type:complete
MLYVKKTVKIKHFVCGAYVTILPDVTNGKGAIIAAGTDMTKSVLEL